MTLAFLARPRACEARTLDDEITSEADHTAPACGRETARGRGCDDE